MTTKGLHKTAQGPLVGNLPMLGGDESGAKWLIGAVLAAGKDGCQCDSCKLLKRFGSKLSEAMLEEEAGARG